MYDIIMLRRGARLVALFALGQAIACSGGGGDELGRFDGSVPDPSTVRDETGISILVAAHPLFDRLQATGLMEEGSDPGGENESGTFRIKCDFSHALYDDPIVYPNDAGRAHLHMYFGNHTADADSTPSSLLAAGEGTCQGSELNRSAYWIPMVLAPRWSGGNPVMDAHGMRAYDPVLTIDSIDADNLGPDIYYKRVTAGDVVPMPTGLRMIVGRASATTEQTGATVRYVCESTVHSGSPEYAMHIPICDVGDAVLVEAFFPSCWDGVHLDVEDHASHMDFPGPGAGGRYVCPATHPVPLPQVSYHLKFVVTSENGGPTGSSRGWRLASDVYDVPDDGDVGGRSLHADWFMAWHPEAVALWTEHCINERRHCANGDLGNGFRLERMVRGPQTIPEVEHMGHGAAH